jgi:C4-dicarboxylate-specific signal transduction histidine kinase
MAALGRLSAAIAHEFRQPLTAMAGAVNWRVCAAGMTKTPGQHR